LHQEVVTYFEHAQQDRTIDAKPLATHETADKGHGRLETRRVWCSDAPGVDERAKALEGSADNRDDRTSRIRA
jgi:hypothetical protein